MQPLNTLININTDAAFIHFLMESPPLFQCLQVTQEKWSEDAASVELFLQLLRDISASVKKRHNEKEVNQKKPNATK